MPNNYVTKHVSSKTGDRSIHVTIREFQPTDQRTIHAIFRDGMLGYVDAAKDDRAIWQSFVDDGVLKDMADISTTYIKPGGNFWVATTPSVHGDEDEIVGMVGLQIRTDDGKVKSAELRRMSVQAPYRCFGIGRVLALHLEHWARNNGISVVTLATHGTIGRFYVGLGYAVTHSVVYSEQPRFVIDYYRKRLGSPTHLIHGRALEPIERHEAVSEVQ